MSLSAIIPAPAGPDWIETAIGRARELSGLIYAIEAGELLSEVPGDLAARARHQAGVSLLSVLERELAALVADLEGASGYDVAH